MLTHEYQLPYQPVKSFLWNGETKEQAEQRSHREIYDEVKFHCRISFDDILRGGSSMTAATPCSNQPSARRSTST